MNALSSRCLVLNKSWTPLKTITVRSALKIVSSHYEDGNREPKGKIIDPESYAQMTWSDWTECTPKEGELFIRTPGKNIKIPSVILLSRYNKIPKKKSTFNRRGIFDRDKYTCQYCGKKPRGDELSIDHVLPRAQGGLSTWENCVVSCFQCNSKKANRTPKQAGMKLLKEPVKPNSALLGIDLRSPIDSWKLFISDMYWEVPLQD